MENNDKFNAIKAIFPVSCPDCGKQIFINFKTLASISSEKEMKEAKEEALKRLDLIEFKNDEIKKGHIDWISKDETLIGPDDVEPLIRDILNSNK
jgi:hypothetical protein